MTPAPAGADAAAAAAERLLNQGEPLLAYNVVQEALRERPEHVRLRQLQGLALARSGDVEEANRVLARLAAEGLGDAETLGMLARTHKDLALGHAEPARRAGHLEAAFGLYSRAYESARRRGATADAYYTGINAATVAVLRGDLPGARRIATEVRELCEQARRAGPAATDYWLTATLGEAALILGDAEGAAAHYAAAAALAAGNYGNLGSTRRQAELLAGHLPGDRRWIRSVLSLPPVLVYTGHRIDDPDRAAPRFPASLEPVVRAALAERLAALRPLAVYGSAASGTDLLCLELARELGAETHVVLPFPAAAFRRVSVEPAGGTWPERFDRALATAGSVTVTSDHHARDSAATFEYANLVLTGMGRLRGQLLGASVRALAVWDPAAAGAAGGAASIVALWRERGLAVDHVDLAPLRGGAPAPTHAPPPLAPASRPAGGARHEIRAMLFADAVGFSQLSEDQIPGFVSGFLGAVAALNARTSHRPEHVESAGDGLYMVFRRVEDAARYALELNAVIDGCDRAAAGLPPGFVLRIALHCGPVYCGWNPVTQAPLYTGPHTSRAARIEPITPPGQVYASSAFAAAALASGVDDLAMRYVGRIPLPKNHGTLALYHVRRPA